LQSPAPPNFLAAAKGFAVPDRILIVKLSSLGDVIHTLPAAQALRRKFPKAHLAWAVERAHAGVLRDQECFDELIEWNRGTWRDYAAFLRRLRATKWDLAIDFQGLFRSGFVTWASGARRRIGYDATRERAHWFYNERVTAPTEPLHAVEKSLRLIESLGARLEGVPLKRKYLEATPLAPGNAPGAIERTDFAHTPVFRGAHDADGQPLFPLSIRSAERAAVDAWLTAHRFDERSQKLVVLNPHCRKAANIWPAERYAHLAARLLEQTGVRVVISGGPVAKELCDEIAAPLGEKVWRADGTFTLLGSAELIRRADLFITGDTGPMHIAAAVGTPIVALFGPADPLKTGPYTTDAVVLTKRLPCAPCFAKQCPLGHRPAKCMTDISVEDVTTAAMAALDTLEIKLPQRTSA
ncbi:MAG: glycosyltransferase family 9 protein, partial [Planctomycetes bacterium]|nr:glycosyltransferase family 9 protein [Planctomycetota bacterium]